MHARFTPRLFGALLAATLGACATTPAGPTPTPAAELEADVCATTKSFAELLRDHAKAPPASVRLAHATQWFDLDDAYRTAKSQFEACLDPTLGATVTTGTPVFEGMPPVTATAKFDPHDTGSFTDRPVDNGFDVQSGLSRIELEAVNVPDGVELRMRVH